MPTDAYTPRPEDKFSFGLWTVSNRGRDPFGEAVRAPLPPVDAVALLGEVGAWGVNLHDQRPARPRLCAAENPARDGSRRRARRRDLRVVGRARRYRNRCLPSSG